MFDTYKIFSKNLHKSIYNLKCAYSLISVCSNEFSPAKTIYTPAKAPKRK